MSLVLETEFARVQPNTVIHDFCLQYRAEWLRHKYALTKYCNSIGATQYRSIAGYTVQSFLFPNGIPSGWRRVHGYTSPMKSNIKEWERLRNLPVEPLTMPFIQKAIEHYQRNTSHPHTNIPYTFQYAKGQKSKWLRGNFVVRNNPQIIWTEQLTFFVEVPCVEHMMRMARVQHPKWVFKWEHRDDAYFCSANGPWYMPVESQQTIDYIFAKEGRPKTRGKS